MSVLIRGINKPFTCGDCWYWEHCERWHNRNWGASPPDDCPIEAAPADVVEVRHGEWEEVRYDEADGYYILYRCSHCGCERPKRDNYCKDCGAKMDGGAGRVMANCVTCKAKCENAGQHRVKTDCISYIPKDYPKPQTNAPDKNVGKWIPVTERLPESGVHVLASCCVKYAGGGGHSYVCDAFYSGHFKEQRSTEYDDIELDYDEETDEYYLPEGWWEVIRNWDEYGFVSIADFVTHWMPLPEPPKEE